MDIKQFEFKNKNKYLHKNISTYKIVVRSGTIGIKLNLCFIQRTLVELHTHLDGQAVGVYG